ncbi:MAG: hypothetical protein ACRDTA_17755 [Pseudonocardiaceae bacterium]
MLPVAARTGYLPEQVSLHHGLVPEPVWFDWSDDAPFDHGARLLEAIQTAHAAIQDGWQVQHAEKFADRHREHVEVMAEYRTLYEGGQ